ncbi:hypothetical protein KQI84_02890 [bacterium]|nr:hypothetical protein [bacterium]
METRKLVQATHVALRRCFAIKTVSKTRASAKQEALIQAGLAHPCVLPVYDLVPRSGRDGLLLTQWLDDNGKWWSELLAERSSDLCAGDSLAPHIATLLTIAQTVEYAHTRGIVHADLKPENIYVGPHGRVYLCDWGHAVFNGSRDELIRASWGPALLVLGDDALFARQIPIGSTLCYGTPYYVAPEAMPSNEAELADSHVVISTATDVWLLGGILFEILTGYPPHHPGEDREVHSYEAIAIACRGDLNSQALEQAPEELRQLAIASLSAAQQLRPTTGEFIAALEAYLSGAYLALGRGDFKTAKQLAERIPEPEKRADLFRAVHRGRQRQRIRNAIILILLFAAIGGIGYTIHVKSRNARMVGVIEETSDLLSTYSGLYRDIDRSEMTPETREEFMQALRKTKHRYDEAVAVVPQVVLVTTERAGAHYLHLTKLSYDLGELDFARECIEAEVELRTNVLEKHPNDLCALSDYAFALRWKIRTLDDETPVVYYLHLAEEQVDVCERLEELDPTNPGRKYDTAQAYNLLGSACRSNDDPEQALDHFRKAADIQQGLVDQYPRRTYTGGLFNQWNKIAGLLLSLDRREEARELLERSLLAQEEYLSTADDPHVSHYHYLALTHYYLYEYWRSVDSEKAQSYLTAAAEQIAKPLAAYPENPDYNALAESIAAAKNLAIHSAQ